MSFRALKQPGLVIVRTFLVFVGVVLCCGHIEAHAQVETPIGTINTTDSTYSCVSVPGKSAKVKITRSSGKLKSLSKAKARRDLSKVSKVIRKRIKTAKRIIKIREKKLKKFQDSLGNIFDPKFRDKVEKLRLDIQTARDRLPILMGDVDQIKAFRLLIKDCQTSKGINAGTNIVVIETGNTPVNQNGYYMMAVFHIFDATGLKGGQHVCRVKDGVVGTQRLSVSFCYDWQDRRNTPTGQIGPDFTDCVNAPEDLPRGTGVFFVTRGAGYFSDGNYDSVLAIMNERAAERVEIYKPDKNGRC